MRITQFVYPHVIAFALAAAVMVSHVRAAMPTPPQYDHVVIVIEENESFGRVMGSGYAPYLDALAAGGVSFTNFYAITHPSQPNYLELFSGDNQGCFDDKVSADAPYSTSNLADAIGAANFVGYSEDLPAIGSLVGNAALYARKHCPWVNWQGNGDRQLPESVNRPFFATTDGKPDTHKPFNGDLGTLDAAGGLNYAKLPKVTFVIPNLINDMHNGGYPKSVQTGDAWLKKNISDYTEWARAHNSLLIVTFDEDNWTGPNKIPTILYGAHLNVGTTSDTAYTLHNLLRTVEEIAGAAYHSGSAANVPPISTVFQNQPVGIIRTFQQGDAGYKGAHDDMLRPGEPAAEPAGEPAQAAGSTDMLVVDAADPANGGKASQVLIRFDGLFGNAVDQIPAGATILSAKLILKTGSDKGDSSKSKIHLHRMLTAWKNDATWDSLIGGVAADGKEAAVVADFSLIPNLVRTIALFDVTQAVQSWSDGAANHGWVIIPGGQDGWHFHSSKANPIAQRPRLEITFMKP